MKYPFLIIFLFSLWYCPKLKAQEFPVDWQGHWSGNLVIYQNGTAKDTVRMQLKIDSLDEDRYTWQIIYGNDQVRGLRDYRLLRDSIEQYRYWIDEQNSIVLPAKLIGNRLISSFDVSDNVLFVKYELIRDQILVEISSAPSKDPYITGGEFRDGQDIPSVKGYEIRTFQTALLKRLKP